MKLLQYNNYQVEPTPEAFMSKVIRDLYNEDKSKNKENFMQQMSIVYFMEDPRSTYSDIVDRNDRLNEIMTQEGIKVKMTDKLYKAMEYYAKSCETSSSKLLESAKKAVDKIRVFLENVDFYEEDEKGKPKYTIDSVTRALLSVDKIADSVSNAEKRITKELEEQSRMRGGSKNSSLFEDGDF